MTDAVTDIRDLGRQIAPLAQAIRELCGDDDLAFADTLEGETDAIKAVSAAVRTAAAMEAMSDAAKGLGERYMARARDFAERASRARNAIAQFLQDIGERKLMLPEATISLGQGTPSVLGEPDIDLLADSLIRIKKEPNRTAIKEALMAGFDVPGCYLSNAAPRLQIRTR